MPRDPKTKLTPHKPCVLVIDDEENVRRLIRVTLLKAGYDILEAADGRQAIAVLSAVEPSSAVDVIICDIRMPEVNGVEAITYFVREFPSIPITVLTGFPDSDMAASLLKQGVVDYVTKPVDSNKLLEVVRKALEQRSSLKASVKED
jgi:two-component system chemotaxis response regulator CheY